MTIGLRTLVLATGLLTALGATFPAHAVRDRLDTPALQSRLAVHGLFNSVVRAGQRLVAVGERGHILFSDDQGVTWHQAEVPVSSDLTAVHFPSPTHGWAVGHDGIVLASTDAGAHWTRQWDGRAAAKQMKDHYAANPPADLPGGDAALAAFQADVDRNAAEGADKPFLDVWFENESNGYVVGLFNLVFRTRDGGKTWMPLYHLTDNPQRLHLYAIRPFGGSLYIAGEQGLLLRLDAATQRFAALPVDYRGTFFGLVSSGEHLIAYGLRGSVFRSDAAGLRWQKVETRLAATLTGGARTADGRVVLGSQSGHLLQSTDGGASFTPMKRAPRPISSLSFSASDALVIAGPRGLQSIEPSTPVAAPANGTPARPASSP